MLTPVYKANSLHSIESLHVLLHGNCGYLSSNEPFYKCVSRILLQENITDGPKLEMPKLDKPLFLPLLKYLNFQLDSLDEKQISEGPAKIKPKISASSSEQLLEENQDGVSTRTNGSQMTETFHSEIKDQDDTVYEESSSKIMEEDSQIEQLSNSAPTGVRENTPSFGTQKVIKNPDSLDKIPYEAKKDASSVQKDRASGAGNLQPGYRDEPVTDRKFQEKQTKPLLDPSFEEHRRVRRRISGNGDLTLSDFQRGGPDISTIIKQAEDLRSQLSILLGKADKNVDQQNRGPIDKIHLGTFSLLKISLSLLALMYLKRITPETGFCKITSSSNSVFTMYSSLINYFSVDSQFWLIKNH